MLPWNELGWEVGAVGFGREREAKLVSMLGGQPGHRRQCNGVPFGRRVLVCAALGVRQHGARELHFTAQ